MSSSVDESAKLLFSKTPFTLFSKVVPSCLVSSLWWILGVVRSDRLFYIFPIAVARHKTGRYDQEIHNQNIPDTGDFFPFKLPWTTLKKTWGISTPPIFIFGTAERFAN